MASIFSKKKAAPQQAAEKKTEAAQATQEEKAPQTEAEIYPVADIANSPSASIVAEKLRLQFINAQEVAKVRVLLERQNELLEELVKLSKGD